MNFKLRLLLASALFVTPLTASAQFSSPRSVDDIEIPAPKKHKGPAKDEEPVEDTVEAIDESEAKEEVFVPGRQKRKDPLLEAPPVPVVGSPSTPTPSEARPDAGSAAPLVGTGSAAPAPADAARPPDAPAGEAPKAPGSEQKKEVKDIVVPAPNAEAAIAEAWEERKKAVIFKNFGKVQEADKKLKAARDELGYPNLFSYAIAIGREAEGLMPLDPNEALRRAIFAAELAPDLPSIHWVVARAAFNEDQTNFGRTLGSVRDAVNATLQDPRWRRPLMADLLLSLLAAFFAAGALTVLLVFARHARNFFHDFRHLFPRGAGPIQTTILAVIVLALPAILQLGPFAVLFGLAFATWLYMELAERIVVGLFFALVGAVPLCAALAATTGSFAGTTAEAVYLSEHGGVEPGTRLDDLARLLARPSPPFEVVFSAGHRARLNGRLDVALEHVKHAAELKPSSYEAIVELGNVLVLKGDLDSAKETYQRAVDLAPSRPEGWANLSRVYNRRAQLVSREEAGAEISKAQDATRKAVEIDPKLAYLASSDIDYRANKFVTSVPLSGDSLVALAEAEAQGARVADQVRKRLLGFAPAAVAPVFPAILVGLLLLLGLAHGKLAPSTPCSKCGRTVCRRCDPDVVNGGLCGQCVHVFAKRGAVDAPTRVAKEIGIRKYQRRRESAIKLVSLLASGAGDVLLGRPLQGIALLSVFLFLVMQLLFRSGLVLAPVGAAPATMKLVPVVLFAALVYFVAVRRAFNAFKAAQTAPAQA